jgi:hypothetical protein
VFTKYVSGSLFLCSPEVEYAKTVVASAEPVGETAPTIEILTNLPIQLAVVQLGSQFVRASSRSKAFVASVTGSWSKRGVFAGTDSISPWELTPVVIDTLVNEGTGNVTGVGMMNGIVRVMAAVVAR